ncbi:hypothetical protein PSTT_03348 [Puccinia striiformis]|uniref:Secreted protein n=1 Tax=Puccinia striiformis TaxID=27350 RepID=A0A2S4VWT1_9BASI|nr:hypothetical protein PSTT_03348 [Puccinia striiformis]
MQSIINLTGFFIALAFLAQDQMAINIPSQDASSKFPEFWTQFNVNCRTTFLKNYDKISSMKASKPSSRDKSPRLPSSLLLCATILKGCNFPFSRPDHEKPARNYSYLFYISIL